MSAILSALPFLLILACPLMMIFMMKGMGGRKRSGQDMTGRGTVDQADDARIAELEREVADLRDRPSTGVGFAAGAKDRR